MVREGVGHRLSNPNFFEKYFNSLNDLNADINHEWTQMDMDFEQLRNEETKAEEERKHSTAEAQPAINILDGPGKTRAHRRGISVRAIPARTTAKREARSATPEGGRTPRFHMALSVFIPVHPWLEIRRG